jgi:hypothetical protein
MIKRKKFLKRSPLKRSSNPIKKIRVKPRRGAGCDVIFREWERSRGCVISRCGTTEAARAHECDTAPTFHHVRWFGSPKSDRSGLALCASGHLHDFGEHSIERGKRGWEEHWGIDIRETVERENAEYDAR